MVDTQTLNAGDYIQHAEADVMYLDEVPIPTASLTELFTSRFDSKITIGDYTKDSDNLLSTQVQSVLAGGALIDQHQEGATDSRFSWGCAWTMSPEQLALPPRHEQMTFGAAIASGETKAYGPIAVPLIEHVGVMYVAMGKELWKVTGDPYSYTNMAWNKVLDLPGYARGAACLCDEDRFWIPLGEDGVQLIIAHTHPSSPDTLGDYSATVKAVAITAWDGKQFAVTLDNDMRISPAGSYTWDVKSYTVNPGDSMRNIGVFYDQTGQEAVYLTTDRGLYAYDPEADKLYGSSIRWPRHHNNGLGFQMWRDDALYISSGLAVTRYTRDGVRTDMGLDRDDGIPADRLGPIWGKTNLGYPPPSRSITAMAGAQNFLVAAVQLGKSGVDGSGNWLGDYAICVWNESGWHVLYEGAIAIDADAASVGYPTALLVTENIGGYRIWWGEGAGKDVAGSTATSAYLGQPTIHSVPIPRAFHAPRQQVLDNIDYFADNGYYESGWFDAGMRGFKKTWSHVEVYLTDPNDGQPLQGSVTVSYRTDDNPSTWVVLGTATTYGKSMIPFNVDAQGFPRGSVGTAIELRVDIATSNSARSPIINSIVLKFMKMALPGRAWTLSVPFEGEEQWGIGPNELTSLLARRTYEGSFSWLKIRDRSYRVSVSQVQTIKSTGDVPNRTIQVSLIEVPIAGDSVWGGAEDG